MLVPIPERPTDALTGSAFAKTIEKLSLVQKREDLILTEYAKGNVPSFLRHLCDVTVTLGGNTLTYSVLPDYLCVGSNEDYLRTPLFPTTAQKIADQYECILPTRKMVNDIWKQSEIKVGAENLPPNLPPPNDMFGTPYYVKHSKLIDSRLAKIPEYQPGKLVAGPKKDIVITQMLTKFPKNVAIYGWFYLNGKHIQGMNPKDHNNLYADYSHGVRLVSKTGMLNDNPVQLIDVLSDPALCGLLSDEGVITFVRYPT